MIESDGLCEVVVEGMKEKKALNIAVIDLKKVPNAISDYFIICSASSNTQAGAICESIDEFVFKKTGQHPWHQEGKSNGEWILIDYANVVAHVFLDDKRSHFGLEELWGDGTITYIDKKPNSKMTRTL